MKQLLKPLGLDSTGVKSHATHSGEKYQHRLCFSLEKLQRLSYSIHKPTVGIR